MSTSPPTPRSGRSRWVLVGVVIGLVAGAGGFYAYERYVRNAAGPPPDDLALLRQLIERLPPDKLAPGYADADGDLVADPPPADRWAKVGEELTFSVVPSPRSVPPRDENGEVTGPSDDERDWKPVMDALAGATRKKVRFMAEVQSTEEQWAAVREGRLHVTAFSTGAVPAAVNTAGFVPLAVPADADGQFAIDMRVVARADGPVRSPADLKGRTLGLVSLSSNSGGKAPLVLLHDKYGLLPGRVRGGYDYRFTGDHRRGLVELLDGKLDAVCVAGDLFDQAVRDGKVRYRGEDRPVRADQFHTVAAEGSFPPLCFGVPHSLPPDVRSAVGAGLRAAKPPGRAKFVAVDYRKDWADVRRIDDALARLIPPR